MTRPPQRPPPRTRRPAVGGRLSIWRITCRRVNSRRTGSPLACCPRRARRRSAPRWQRRSRARRPTASPRPRSARPSPSTAGYVLALPPCRRARAAAVLVRADAAARRRPRPTRTAPRWPAAAAPGGSPSRTTATRRRHASAPPGTDGARGGTSTTATWAPNGRCRRARRAPAPTATQGTRNGSPRACVPARLRRARPDACGCVRLLQGRPRERRARGVLRQGGVDGAARAGRRDARPRRAHAALHAGPAGAVRQAQLTAAWDGLRHEGRVHSAAHGRGLHADVQRRADARLQVQPLRRRPGGARRAAQVHLRRHAHRA